MKGQNTEHCIFHAP